MPIDLSQEHDDEGLAPGGLYKLRAAIVPGGYGDDDVLTLSKKGNLAFLKLSNTIVGGAYDGQRIYDMLNVEQVKDAIADPEQLKKDENTVKWHRGKAKRIVASARAVDIEKADADTLSKLLTINSWGDLDGLVYWAVVGIEPAKNGYKAKNTVESIVTPADVNWPGEPGQPRRPISKPKHADFDDEVPF